MLIIDTALKKREAEGKPVRVGMIGAGFMGRGLANQILNSVPGMVLSAVSNRSLAGAKRAYVDHGAAEPAVATTLAQLEDAIRAGKPVITEDADLLVDSDSIDCLVDVTGAVEFGARITMRAIERKKHMVTMNAELDGTVGPLLKAYADKAGIVLTGCDGDQPGVQMNLFRFVKGLGVTPLVCGNIKGLQDEHRNPTTQKGFAEKWGQNPYMVTSFADGTKISFEQAIVANATGMTVAKRGMVGREHAGHVDELTKHYDVEQLKKLGGVVDYVVKSLPSPGVFVLGTHDDPKQRHYLNLYKLGEGPLYSFYTPYHLCHFEVPNSVARAVLFHDAVLQPIDGPKVDVITTSKIPLKAGDVIDELGGYKSYGVAESYAVSRKENLLPMGLAEGCKLKRDIPADTALTYDDVEIPPGRFADKLRAEQDARWPE
ncbi:MAG: putative NAD(P)-dependent oxidoreductase [Myxococcaceae bacterium]|nr:putative NAD(P)-dependent oxidoreductase [Myxococcaceae bacterium]